MSGEVQREETIARPGLSRGTSARLVATTNACILFVDASVFVVTNDVDGIALILSIRSADGSSIARTRDCKRETTDELLINVPPVFRGSAPASSRDPSAKQP